RFSRRLIIWSGPKPPARYPEDTMTLPSNPRAPGDSSSSRGRKPARRVAVYCVSAFGNNPAYLTEAKALCKAIAAAGLGLVYGGASVGLMGAVADAALKGGAEVIGVLPDVLAGKEIAHSGLSSLELVSTMHERKARMAELADAFLALPGGYGTLEELLEAVTWAQLRLHAKPCILINTAGYWDGLLEFLDTAVAAGFVKQKNRALLRVAASAEEAVGMVAAG
ncbi:MAG: TIGR00730 family Rossman fold protein, partial [Terracidiphilus sp.]